MPVKLADPLLRVHALRSTRLVQNASEPFYDAIRSLAATQFGVEMVEVLFVDAEQHWRASDGHFACTRVLCDIPFCRDTLLHDGVTWTADAAKDPRFADDPCVNTGPKVRFYAGAPLTMRNGDVIGLLCLVDPAPRPRFGADEIARLLALAGVVAEHLQGVRSAVYQDPATELASLPRLMEDMQRFLQVLDTDAQPESYAVLVDVYSLADINHLVIAVGILAVSQVAIAAAKRLKAALPPDIVLYRVGYARFAFFMPNGYPDLVELAQRCTDAFAGPLTVGESVPIDVTPHIGVVRLGATADAFDLASELVAVSEEARRLRIPMLLGNASFTAKTRRTFEIINSVKHALQSDGQFRLVYQPVVDLQQNRVTKLEALIRWTHPTLGELMPGEFLPLIESTALMSGLTTWVLDAAARQLGAWGEAASHIKLAVNIGASDLMRDELDKDLEAALAAHGVGAHRFECEVTETALVSSFEQGMRNIKALKQMGIAVAIDDFGAGYSNLAYLQRFAVDALKIDQSLVRSITDNTRDAAIVRTAISLAHELGYSVTIEGVETQDILDRVQTWGAECAQGYAISRPMEADAVLPWIAPTTVL